MLRKAAPRWKFPQRSCRACCLKLFIPSLEIPDKGKHDILFVATEHDTVYAFDANRPNDPPLWHISLLGQKQGATTVPAPDVQCFFIQPEVGITSTPVIDLKTGTLYVLARTMIDPMFGSKEYFQHLHALAITTGVEKFDGPKLISASVPGKGAGGEHGQVRSIRCWRIRALRCCWRTILCISPGLRHVTWTHTTAGSWHTIRRRWRRREY